MSLDDLPEPVRRILEGLPVPNRDTIADFLAEKRATTSAKEGTLVMYATHLKPWAEVMGERPFDEATKKDVVRFLNQRKGTRRIQPRGARTPVFKAVELKESTMNTRKTVLKQFQRWVRQSGKEDPPEVEGVRINRKANETPITDEDVLSPEEIQRLIEAAQGVQEKAVVAILGDAGLRVSEFCQLNVSSVRFDQGGCVLNLPREGKGLKTGVRRVRLITSVPYLAAWMNAHPHKDDPKMPLWIGSNTARSGLAYENDGVTPRRMTPGSVRGTLRRVRNAAGLHRDVRPHGLRHSAVTNHLKAGLKESAARLHFGWSKTSDVLHRYSHVNYEHVETDMLARAGLLTDEAQEQARAHAEALRPRRCGCGHLNPPRALHCERAVCGRPLTLEAAENQQRAAAAAVFDQLRSQPEILQQLIQDAGSKVRKGT